MPQLQRPWFRRHPFYSRREETWNFRRVLRLMGVENIPLRAPYIEGEIWGSSLSTKLKERMSNEMNSTRSPREPSVSRSAPPHKGTIEYASRIPSNSRYPRRGSVNGDAPRTPKRQERAMDNRKSSGVRKKAKLNRPCYRPENVKTLLLVRGSGQQDFEGLLWGQRI